MMCDDCKCDGFPVELGEAGRDLCEVCEARAWLDEAQRSGDVVEAEEAMTWLESALEARQN